MRLLILDLCNFQNFWMLLHHVPGMLLQGFACG
jgi:hypothetical protein